MTETYLDKAEAYLNRMRQAIEHGYREATADIALYVEHFVQRYESLRKELTEEARFLEYVVNLGVEKAKSYTERLSDGLRELHQQIETYSRQQPKPTTRHNHHPAAVAVIIILAFIGLGSFLFVSNDTSGRVVTPSVANLPLGVMLMTILVIGVMIMPHRNMDLY